MQSSSSTFMRTIDFVRSNLSGLSVLFFITIVALFLAMTIKGTNQACAACKYQRRKCHKDCLLAPYFPAEHSRLFLYAHRLFGVSNISKILNQVPPNKKEEAMRSIVYESYIRARFPVYGCLGVIWQLHHQRQQILDEIRLVHAKLAACKRQTRYQVSPMSPSPSPSSSSSSPQLQSFPTEFGSSMINHLPCGTAIPPIPSNFSGSGYYVEPYDEDLKLKFQASSSSSMGGGLPLGQEIMKVSQDYYDDDDDDDIAHENIPDDRESYMESSEAYDQSSAESLLLKKATQRC